MRTNSLLRFIQGLAILGILAMVDHWLFTTVFKITYLQWYITNGALIATVTTLISLGFSDINKQTGLISSHPLDYFSACLQIPGVLFSVMKEEFEGYKGKWASLSIFDILLMVIITIVLIVLSFGWLIIITPLNFVIILICGAPGRLFANSAWRVIAQIGIGKTKKIRKSEEVPDGWWDASLSSKPVTFTNAIASLLFIVLKAIIN